MIVSINQPAYLPWLGYFHRIAVSDIHIILDHAQFEKNSFTNRNKVRTSGAWCWLTVPVKTKGLFGDLAINGISVDNSVDWRKKHLLTICHNYSKAPHLAEHKPFFTKVYQMDWSRLLDLCCEINSQLLKVFGIGTPLRFASEMHVNGTKDELVLNLCRAVGATTYLSGPQGRNYLHEDMFRSAGIHVVYQDYQHPTYTQAYPGFEAYVSAIDLLFNYGDKSGEILCSGQKEIFEKPKSGSEL